MLGSSRQNKGASIQSWLTELALCLTEKRATEIEGARERERNAASTSLNQREILGKKICVSLNPAVVK